MDSACSLTLLPTHVCALLQEKTPVRGQPECLLELTGQDLIGVPLKVGGCWEHELGYTLPTLG